MTFINARLGSGSYDGNPFPYTYGGPQMKDVAAVNKDKLMHDLKVVIADAEELLRLTADQAGGSVADVRSRVQARMNQAKTDLIHLQDTAVAQVKAAGLATDEFVHTNPWKSISMAAGLGVILGLMAGRR
jgi:ElaB/YqjD/DUF883 family membrane-anchored ribosome-binding protein